MNLYGQTVSFAEYLTKATTTYRNEGHEKILYGQSIPDKMRYRRGAAEFSYALALIMAAVEFIAYSVFLTGLNIIAIPTSKDFFQKKFNNIYNSAKDLWHSSKTTFVVDAFYLFENINTLQLEDEYWSNHHRDQMQRNFINKERANKEAAVNDVRNQITDRQNEIIQLQHLASQHDDPTNRAKLHQLPQEIDSLIRKKNSLEANLNN